QRGLPARYDVEGWLDEFSFSLRNELDYALEGRNAERFAKMFEGERLLRVPSIYWEYTTRRVLTMERLSGVKINDFAALDALGVARTRVSRSALTRDLDHLMHTYLDRELGEIPMAQLFRDLMQTVQRHQMQLPAELALLAKVLAMHEGLGTAVYPAFKLAQFARPYLRRFWIKSRSPRAMMRTLEESTSLVGDMVVDLPKRVRMLLGMAER